MSSSGTKNVSNFNTRTKTAIWLLVFFALFFTFAMFSDPSCLIVPSWSEGTQLWFPLAFWIVNVCLLSWTNFLVAKEINNCFIKSSSKLVEIILAIIFLTFELSISFSYVFDTYKIVEHNITFEIMFLALMFILTPLLFILCASLTYYFAKTSISNCLCSGLACCIVSLTYVSIYYITASAGWSTLLIMASIPCLNDIFAYLFGVKYGKHKMCPHISPKKSWEGFVSGNVFGILITVLIILLFYLPSRTSGIDLNFFSSFVGWQVYSLDNKDGFIKLLDSNMWWVYAIIFILMLNLISVGGDLLFSTFKRKNMIKDFSNNLPGHGGILDRFDSISLVLLSYFIVSVIVSASATGIGENSTLIHFLSFV